MNILDRILDVEEQLESLLIRAELWQFIFDEYPIAIACFDDKMNFFLVNHEFILLTGFNRDSIIGEKLKVVIPPQYRKSHSKYEANYKNNPQKRMNFHGISPQLIDVNGKIIDVNIDISYIDYQDKIYYIAFIKRK